MIDIPEGVHRIRHCRVRRVAGHWPFAVAHQKEIAQHWQERSRANPKFFNGRVFVMTEASLQNGELEGKIVETDFASSLYWRETGFVDKTVADCFAAAIILTADDALIYGRQAAGNVNTGFAYPPSGFLDSNDVWPDGTADLEASAAREVQEETGFSVTDLNREPGLLLLREGPYLCVGVIFRASRTSDDFIEAVTAHLHSEKEPELEAMIALKRNSDIALHPMRSYAQMIAAYFLKA